METKEETTKVELEESDHHLVQLDVGESVSFKTTSPEMLDDRIPDIPSGKSHHLFISHSEEDAEWVEHLVKVLEDKHGVTCLWPKRDFLAGQGVPGLIQRGIAESMKVVFVLTPDSLESPWCEQERDWAIVLSMEERQNRIIPLLLTPCKIPDIFNTFNYIDVPKGEDYVNRTIRALAGKDLSDLQPRVINFLRTQGSGLNMEFNGYKCSTYMCGGPSWAFGDLTESQRLKLSRLGSEFAENVYQEAKDIANRSREMKFYSLSNPFSCHAWGVYLCGVLLTTLMVCIVMIPLIYYTDVFYDALYMLIVIGVAVIAIPGALWLFARKNEKKLRDVIQGHSIRNVMKTRILINYNNVSFQPTLMYYDLSPCLRHVSDHVMNQSNVVQFETETLERFKTTVVTIIFWTADVVIVFWTVTTVLWTAECISVLGSADITIVLWTADVVIVLWTADITIVLWTAEYISVLWTADITIVLWTAECISVLWTADITIVLWTAECISVLGIADITIVLWTAECISVLGTADITIVLWTAECISVLGTADITIVLWTAECISVLWTADITIVLWTAECISVLWTADITIVLWTAECISVLWTADITIVLWTA
ncbi:uncharacterized protein LOC124264313 isoform X2 [Haliotis rubra]|uniref:uncharacterized protein LOC124264313 isoform X2 n=1 Tax=Haliotis rubra TaxID=36100 RepID=UPI001EE5D390|nr:uncharacterized protein LOC124264313 isoform X2 [Haliotis rubra]